jgi:hypothetical protein
MSSSLPKKLKFVQAFNEQTGRTHETQSGYQKIDDDRVLERYFVPVVLNAYSDKSVDRTQAVTTVYDFKSFMATVYTTALNPNLSIAGETQVMTPFSAIENKQAVLDARRALIELGGHPAEVEDYLNVATKRDIKPMGALQLTPKK